MQTIDRLARILRVIADAPDGLTMSEVASAVELPSPTVHRFLKSLDDAGFVERQELTRRYVGGSVLMRLGLAAKASDFGGHTEEGGLRSLGERWQECFYLSSYIDGDVVCVRSTETTDPLRMSIFVSVGRRLPMHSSAAAKAILAYQPREVAESFLASAPFDRYTGFTITERDQVVSDLVKTRNQGYAVCDQEMEIGVSALAVPIFDPRGAVGRSLGVIAPRERLLFERRHELLEHMREAAAAIGHLLP